MADSPALLNAKYGTGDMDLRCGFDVQAVFGAGIELTFSYLDSHAPAGQVAELRNTIAADGMTDVDVERWAEAKRRYFYE